MNETRRRVVTAEIPDGPNVLVEVQAAGSKEADVGIADRFGFDAITDSVQAVAKQMSAGLDQVKPDRAAVEFGVDMTVESGGLSALIVKGAGTATIKVTLEWDHRKPAK
ncbi:MAG TPA: CU044_2847 family protein [Thermoleophilaceae bacterium]|jgi:hypothetical protein